MKLKTSSLPPSNKQIICDKATERPFTGEYNQFDQEGTFLCRQCGLALFRANAKFISACGWPSFDQEILGAVRTVLDADGQRTKAAIDVELI